MRCPNGWRCRQTGIGPGGDPSRRRRGGRRDGAPRRGGSQAGRVRGAGASGRPSMGDARGVALPSATPAGPGRVRRGTRGRRGRGRRLLCRRFPARPWPALLAAGGEELLRRLGERDALPRSSRPRQAIFSELGAPLWLARAEKELRRARPRPRHDRDLSNHRAPRRRSRCGRRRRTAKSLHNSSRPWARWRCT